MTTTLALRLFGIFFKLILGAQLFVPLGVALVCCLFPHEIIDGVLLGLKGYLPAFRQASVGVAFAATLLSEYGWTKPEVSRESH